MSENSHHHQFADSALGSEEDIHRVFEHEEEPGKGHPPLSRRPAADDAEADASQDDDGFLGDHEGRPV